MTALPARLNISHIFPMIPMLTLCLALTVGVSADSSCDARAASLLQRSSSGRLYGYPASFLGTTNGRPIHLDEPSALPYNFTLPQADMKYSQFGRGSWWNGLKSPKNIKELLSIYADYMRYISRTCRTIDYQPQIAKRGLRRSHRNDSRQDKMAFYTQSFSKSRRASSLRVARMMEST